MQLNVVSELIFLHNEYVYNNIETYCFIDEIPNIQNTKFLKWIIIPWISGDVDKRLKILSKLKENEINLLMFIFIWDTMETEVFIDFFNKWKVLNKYIFIRNEWYRYMYSNIHRFDCSSKINICLASSKVIILNHINRDKFNYNKSKLISECKNGYLKWLNNVWVK